MKDKNEDIVESVLSANKKRKKKHKKSRTIAIVFSTILGVLFLFALTTIITVNIEKQKDKVMEEESMLTSKNDDEISRMSKEELEERIEELEQENKELKEEAERYKILAEQTTKSITSPSVYTNTEKTKSTDDGESKNSDKEKVKTEDTSAKTSNTKATKSENVKTETSDNGL